MVIGTVILLKDASSARKSKKIESIHLRKRGQYLPQNRKDGVTPKVSIACFGGVSERWERGKGERVG